MAATGSPVCAQKPAHRSHSHQLIKAYIKSNKSVLIIPSHTQMEFTAHSLSLASPTLPKRFGCSPSLSPCKLTSLPALDSVTFLGFSNFRTQLQGSRVKVAQRRSFGAIRASNAESPSTVDAERWLLEPVGDGDSRHIGFKVPMPGAFEIVSSEVKVGRLPEKVDMVIPVATVSGLHARIQKKEGNLLVTDLDSTNGTFIDDKRLRPGAVATVLPGSCITFGDTHLAMFQVSKLENVEAPRKPAAPEDILKTGSRTSGSETTA
ncbi:uncharacterized protein LOC131152289 isoform X1 [Malania oleifera]|uniref:uncharacterized protein LOC131152289 isoform X1 n=1 Tax=Malania oleifera TaxID=397392 RepID=UPI0025AE526E|nr:uncharacterized protein LOC131152289 isoform X1 [Malania oleifera]